MPAGHDRARRSLTLNQYLRFRLGSKGGSAAWFNFFIRPFGATSFAQFWRLWNPVYGYFLYHFSYRPLSRILPRSAAVLATFVVCGFLLHDLPAWAATRRNDRFHHVRSGRRRQRTLTNGPLEMADRRPSDPQFGVHRRMHRHHAVRRNSRAVRAGGPTAAFVRAFSRAANAARAAPAPAQSQATRAPR